MPPTTADLRRFLVDAFSDEELRTLCFDYFRDVYDAFSTGMTKTQMIQLVIERCVRRDALANLEAALRAERPEQYEKRLGPPVLVVIPAETTSTPGTPQPVRPVASPFAMPADELPLGPIAFDWVTIPAGEFLMGSDKTRDEFADNEETPQHTLNLPAYRIARVPVTVEQFAVFTAANPGYRTTAEEQGSAWNWTGSKWDEIKGANWAHPLGPESDVRAKQYHPVTCVSWHDALAFCKWAGVRLPTEAEWEKAASWAEGQGSGGAGGRKLLWPWGDREPNSGLCNFDMTVGDTTPVDRYPDGVSPYGLLDVAGNVCEWTSSLWGTERDKPEFGYSYDATDGRENLSAPGTVLRVVRGGSFGDVALNVRCAYRDSYSPDDRSVVFGFRVVSPGF